MDCEFELGILYSTIALLQPGDLLNDWNEVHVSQGFSWRETSVSFGTLNDEPKCIVLVRISDTPTINIEAIRIITVPFLVQMNEIIIASIADDRTLKIENGLYEVLFSATPSNGNGYIKYEFVFNKNENPKARIIRADRGINPPAVLLMEAKPAI